MDMSKAVLPSMPPGTPQALIRGAAAPQPLGAVGLVGLAGLVCIPFLLNQAFTYHLAIFICINTIVVTSLSVLARAGQISLCHGALAGIGAYASVFCVKGLGLPFAVGMLAAMAAAGLVAYLLGRIVLRLQGVYFVLVT
ncbi:MAG TPA: branched-chain amino acid ABC transporter permease, partial [Burkholderiaceae bacterium]|nr:branched-chain amino acid ABC transporter permease [Burkholderiaceae bacterium]